MIPSEETGTQDFWIDEFSFWGSSCKNHIIFELLEIHFLPCVEVKAVNQLKEGMKITALI